MEVRCLVGGSLSLEARAPCPAEPARVFASFRERYTGLLAQAGAAEQAIEVHAVDPGRARGCADVAAVGGQQRGEVAALEQLDPASARILGGGRDVNLGG